MKDRIKAQVVLNENQLNILYDYLHELKLDEEDNQDIQSLFQQIDIIHDQFTIIKMDYQQDKFNFLNDKDLDPKDYRSNLWYDSLSTSDKKKARAERRKNLKKS